MKAGALLCLDNLTLNVFARLPNDYFGLACGSPDALNP